MSDGIVESAKFAFEWRKGGFKKLYFYLALLGLVWLFSEGLLAARLDWLELMRAQAGTSVFAFALALTILLSFFSSAVELLVLQFALKSRKQKARKLETMDFVAYFFLDFVVLIAALTSVFNPRGLVVLVGLVLVSLIALSSNALALWVIAGILFAAYLCVFFYNVLRLSQTQFFFASRESDLFSAMGSSLSATLGNVLWLVLVNLVVYLMVGIVVALAVGVPTLAVAFSTGGMDGLGARVVSTLLSPVMVFSFLFAGTSIFSLLLKRRKKKADWNF
ncbi:MAG: hypothetical protein QXR53_04900 [Candidatus Norongarragalinales archaeon]